MKKFKATLSAKSINNLIKELKDYQNSLNGKLELLVKELTAIGYRVADTNVRSDFKSHIGIEVDSRLESYGIAKGSLVMFDITPIISEWMNKDGGTNKVEVSAMLMEEFGSGSKANTSEITQRLGMGRGTFPNQTHAFESVWHWKDLNGEWHHSSGITPNQPMEKALMEMANEVNKVARRVFRNV